MTGHREPITVEATGETVGEAKWAAIRELEQIVSPLDREAVEFQVVSEGERGLLGVGFTPARVVASVVGAPVAPAEDTGDEAAAARELVERVATAIGADVAVSVAERDAVVRVTCSGADVALLIGKHGQTIDAIQYLANAIARAQGRAGEVIVDAAGYRARRAATLETTARRAAQRASSSGSRVALDPMTAVERKVVHERLKDVDGVQTASEGAEPNRHVVVLPA